MRFKILAARIEIIASLDSDLDKVSSTFGNQAVTLHQDFVKSLVGERCLDAEHIGARSLRKVDKILHQLKWIFNRSLNHVDPHSGYPVHHRDADQVRLLSSLGFHKTAPISEALGLERYGGYGP